MEDLMTEAVEKVYAPHQQRVVEEKEELDKKVELLRKFVTTNPIFESLDVKEQGRLRKQLVCMNCYSDILGDRIRNFT
jgi:hypothetical protein